MGNLDIASPLKAESRTQYQKVGSDARGEDIVSKAIPETEVKRMDWMLGRKTLEDRISRKQDSKPASTDPDLVWTEWTLSKLRKFNGFRRFAEDQA